MTSRPDYDPIVEQYRDFHDEAAMAPVLLQTFLDMVGDPIGANVLDLACGDGTYGRTLLAHRASCAVGIDVSEQMVAHGRRRSKACADTMTFVHADVLDLQAHGTFDIVIAAWLFNHAADIGQLHRMFKVAAQHLKPQGRLFALVPHPGYLLSAGDMAKYGVRIREQTPHTGCQRLLVEFPGSPPAVVEDMQWPAATYAEAARQAGLTAPAWVDACLTPQILALREPDFWNDYLSNPLTGFFWCER